MTNEKFISLLTEELPGYKVTYQYGQSDVELIKAIHMQLKNGIPVPVFFGAENPYNKPYKDFHASVVTGMDLEKKTIGILNVYG